MKIYKALNIGEFHTNYCEDFLINTPVSSHQQLIAVLDGCTMGKESAFASILYGKILRKIAKAKFYGEFINKDSESLKKLLKSIVQELFNETKIVKNQLALEVNELLSTLVIGVLDTQTCEAEFLTVGDGVIYVDGELTEYDQGDKPDYLGYHLSDNFENWYAGQSQRRSITNFNDISISTDGIYTFKNFVDPSKQKTLQSITDYFFKDRNGIENDQFLTNKLQYLKGEYNHVVTDDLAIIRVINN